MLISVNPVDLKQNLVTLKRRWTLFGNLNKYNFLAPLCCALAERGGGSSLTAPSWCRVCHAKSVETMATGKVSMTDNGLRHPLALIGCFNSGFMDFSHCVRNTRRTFIQVINSALKTSFQKFILSIFICLAADGWIHICFLISKWITKVLLLISYLVVTGHSANHGNYFALCATQTWV